MGRIFYYCLMLTWYITVGTCSPLDLIQWLSVPAVLVVKFFQSCRFCRLDLCCDLNMKYLEYRETMRFLGSWKVHEQDFSDAACLDLGLFGNPTHETIFFKFYWQMYEWSTFLFLVLLHDFSQSDISSSASDLLFPSLHPHRQHMGRSGLQRRYLCLWLQLRI